MGLSFGGTTTNSTANASTTPTFTPQQTGLQSSLASLLQGLLPSVASGQNSPQVVGQQTQADNETNTNYNALGKRMNQFLAARGFGQSGQAGQTELQTNLAREGALGTNAANAGAEQLNLDQSYLSDALALAFNTPGSSSTGSTSGSSSGYSANASPTTGVAATLAAVGL
jgi:hypothetical protein